MILVDSGNTHSFLDPKMLSQLKKVPEKATPLTLTVANREQVLCDTVCKNLKWQIQGESFMKNFRLLRLGGYDMVLGMDWVDLFAPIQLHKRPPRISFHKEGKKVWLKGMTRKEDYKKPPKRTSRSGKRQEFKGTLCNVWDY